MNVKRAFMLLARIWNLLTRVGKLLIARMGAQGNIYKGWQAQKMHSIMLKKRPPHREKGHIGIKGPHMVKRVLKREKTPHGEKRLVITRILEFSRGGGGGC